MSNITLARLTELKNRLELLKREAESIVSNVRCVVKRGNAVVAFQESLNEIEHFLRCYPDAGTEIDHLINNLVKLNCELEITLARRSNFCNVLTSCENNDTVFYDGGILEKTALCEVCSKEKKSICTSTDDVTVNNISEVNEESINRLYDIDENSILEMKYLQGDDPSQFWLGYYSDTELLSHLTEINKKLQLGELHCVEATPVIGQYIIGYVDRVFRGCVISVTPQMIVAIDVDTAVLKLLNKYNIWEIGDCLSGFPPQAIFCKLWGVEGNVDWTNHLSTLFKKCLKKCNLVITIKRILPGVIPTFLVDLDAHDGTFLDVNITEWINSFVSPAIEKIKLFGLSGASEETVFQDLDPYVLYREDCSDIDSSTSDQNVANLKDVTVNSEVEVQVAIDRRDESAIDSNCRMENLDETPVKDSSELILHSTSISSEIVPGNFEHDNNLVSENSLINKVSDLYSTDDNVQDASCEQGDTLECKIIKSSEENVKSSVVKCFLEKNQTLGMSFLEGKNPGNFLLSYVSLHEIDVLKKKMADWAECGRLIPFSKVPESNDFAIAKCNNQYYRVCINSVSEQNIEDIVVTDVDTGDLVIVSVRDLWVLDDVFSLPPARAVRCSLWNVPRNPVYWCVELENLFRNVMSRGACCVTVKDVDNTSGSWIHYVQIQIYADCTFDVSEWIMDFVFPNLKDIKQCNINGYSIYEAMSMLDPRIVYSKNHTDNSSTQECVNKQVSSKDAKQPSGMKLPIFEHKNVFLKSSETNPKVTEYLSNTLQLKELTFKKHSDKIQPEKKYYVFLASIVSPNEFYVHIISEENSFIDKMHEDLSCYCTGNKICFKTKKEARQLIPECCAVQYKDRWLRGRIINWFDDYSDVVSIFLVDYGVHLTESFSLIQPLRSDFYEYPVFAERCALAFISPPDGNDIWPEKSLEAFSDVLDYNTVYEIFVVNCLESEILCVFLFENKVDDVWCVNDYLVEKGCAVSEIHNSQKNETENSHLVYYPIIDSGIDEAISDTESVDSGYKQENVEIITYFDNNSAGLPDVGEELSVVLTEIVNMSLFYAVPSKILFEGKLQSTHEVLMKMNKQISSAVLEGQLKLSKRLCEGAIAIARYNKDKNWYRVRLLGSPADNGYVEVYFVDYGNVDTVHKFYIREIRNDFCELPFQAMRFFIDSIDITRLKNKNSREIAQTLLTSLVGMFGVIIKITRVVNEDVEVQVLFDGRDIGAEMIDMYQTQCE